MGRCLAGRGTKSAVLCAQGWTVMEYSPIEAEDAWPTRAALDFCSAAPSTAADATSELVANSCGKARAAQCEATRQLTPRKGGPLSSRRLSTTAAAGFGGHLRRVCRILALRCMVPLHSTPVLPDFPRTSGSRFLPTTLLPLTRLAHSQQHKEMDEDYFALSVHHDDALPSSIVHPADDEDAGYTSPFDSPPAVVVEPKEVAGARRKAVLSPGELVSVLDQEMSPPPKPDAREWLD